MKRARLMASVSASILADRARIQAALILLRLMAPEKKPHDCCRADGS